MIQFLFFFTVYDEDKVAVQLRGLPFNIKYNDIVKLMVRYEVQDDVIIKSLLIGSKKNGHGTGYATFLCGDAEKAKQVQ